MEHRAVRHDEELIHSFLALRRAVGFTGMPLSFAPLLVHGRGLDSVSAGCYTAAIALFVADAAALDVSQIPCCSDKAVAVAFAWGWGAGYVASVWPAIHLVASAVLFILLALLSLWLFPMSDARAHANRKKDQRNRAYYACGAVIVIYLGMLFAHFAYDGWLGVGGEFWVKTAMLLAFGLSWAVKGEGIKLLNDVGASEPAPAFGSNRWTLRRRII